MRPRDPASAASDDDLAHWVLHELASRRGVGNRMAAASTPVTMRADVAGQAMDTLLTRYPRLRRTFGAGPRAAGTYVTELPESSRVTAIEMTLGSSDPARTGTGGHDSPGGTSVPSTDAVPVLVAELGNRRFEAGDLLLRLALLRAPARTVVVLVTHQLASGPLDPGRLLAELLTTYDALAAGRRLAAQRPAAAVDTPPDHLCVVDPVPDHPPMGTARTPSRRSGFERRMLRRRLGPSGSRALDAIAHRYGVKPPAALLTLYAMLLAQHGAGSDIAVGLPDQLCRTGTGRGATVRLQVTAQATFASLLSATESSLESAAAAVSCGPGCPSAAVRWPNLLFRHILDVHSPGGPLDSVTLQGQPVTSVATTAPAATEDLHVLVSIHAAGMDLEASFNPAVHEAADIAAFLARYEHLLHHAGPRTSPVIPLLTASDQSHVAPRRSPGCGREGRTAITDVPPEPVAKLVLDQTRRTPDSLAVDTLTYEGLASAAAGICRRLVDAGVRPGGVVAVTGPRGAMLAAGLLGVWLAGAAYLPVGERMPAGRLITQLDRSGATVILRTGGSAPAVAGWPVIDAEGAGGAPGQAPVVNRRAYVLFTSGSTGEPKGVLITHNSLSNLITDMTGRLPISASDHVLWSTSVTFDISALELWAPLTVGARVTSVADSTLLDANEVLDVIAGRGITVAQGTPTLWQHVAAAADGRLRDRLLLVGGEPFPTDLAERLLAAGARVRNMYGPTETTIWSTTHALTAPVPDPVPIGTPISRTSVQVVGDHGRPVFPGVPGELIIGGAGVADGYCQDSSGGRSPFGFDGAERFYRTGDRVRQRADGVLEFLGRRDRQVKVNGHRVELAEVEAVLSSHPDVSAAAVVASSDPSGRARLSAAITASGSSDHATLTAAVRRHAANHLPRVAVPAPLLVLDTLPTTPNGKTDYSSVAALTGRHASAAAGAAHEDGTSWTTGASAPTGELGTPEDLPRLLLELLRSEAQKDLAPDSDFFRHGGTVAQALALADRIAQCTGRTVPLTALFRAPTVDTLHRDLITKEAPRP
ncbi:non-ribosomal peptide synthetase [Asanoa siamensis]|uniref:Amino acid adenylation domain-containing protein n=1 Tax=Asanoa siamensis TaxID=926357 RepID=A0ABQ4CWF7_9ACTN|nr:non-ribosomal peptide synthetase [Asanoa siamensis]GIF75627.1 hypothetical protein Asi02nite_51450 [Asanoa siamensis]